MAVGAFVLTSAFTPPKAEAKAKKRYKIAVVVPNGVDPYFFSKWYGSVREAKKTGRRCHHVRCGRL
jgi:ABC-type sugar transport system substrate-binding protein